MLRRSCIPITNAHIQQVLPPSSCPPSHETYATYAGNTNQELDDYIWPRSTVSRSNPTPYEILQTRRNDPYDKKCYYRLVKIYHPDRDHHASQTCSAISSLPQTIRIERYRLVVAAHEILSDPDKRSAYDKHGAGWIYTNDRQPASDHPQPTQRREGNPWTGFDSPFANATWEDWERWYERQHGKRPPPQSPIYVSNVGFVILVIGAAIVGAVGQGFNVENHEQFFKDQADKKHEEASSYFRNRLTGAEEGVNRHGQVNRFLKQREYTGYSPPEEPKPRKTLPPPSLPLPTLEDRDKPG